MYKSDIMKQTFYAQFLLMNLITNIDVALTPGVLKWRCYRWFHIS